MGTIERLRMYPVKGLDGIERDEARVLPGGTLEYDREFALFDDDREVFNGKRTDAIHRVATEFDTATRTLIADAPDHGHREFELGTERGRERASAWFSDVFDEDLTLVRDDSLGFVDRREMGPSVISTATLREVASWFDGMSVESARRRLRANVEVGGVPAFWEDRFVGQDAPSFVADDVRFDGETPCARCVVPERDPDTGEALDRFRERFIEQRRETFPEWADESAFDHHFTLMLIASIPESDRDTTLARGDEVRIVGE